jgi:hypothetical protein
MIAMYRRQRIGELKQEEDKARFGRVYPIGREDYTREVTEASKVNELGDDEERGTGVICFLYKDGYVCPALRARVHVCVCLTTMSELFIANEQRPT